MWCHRRGSRTSSGWSSPRKKQNGAFLVLGFLCRADLESGSQTTGVSGSSTHTWTWRPAFASWPVIGYCRSLHASSSSVIRKAAHRRTSGPHSVAVCYRETTYHCGKDNPSGLCDDPPIRFLFLRREPRPTSPDAIPSDCPASPLACTRNRIPTITTRSKTKARFSGAQEECLRSEDTHPSSGEGSEVPHALTVQVCKPSKSLSIIKLISARDYAQRDAWVDNN